MQILASGDWSSFSPRERVALFFAKKLAKTPGLITRDDIALLKRHWGELSSLDLIWHISWRHFMTRVADAFQVPLERENVFLPPKIDQQK